MPTSRREPTRPWISTRPRGRLGDPGEDLEQRALARAVRPDDADDLAALDLERDILERPDVIVVARAARHERAVRRGTAS